MKIVIFGATGIVGKAVVNEALSKGYDVSVLTRDAKEVSKYKTQMPARLRGQRHGQKHCT